MANDFRDEDMKFYKKYSLKFCGWYSSELMYFSPEKKSCIPT